ncbi:hypothetical protein SLA2020_099960 [Shorea laevis]
MGRLIWFSQILCLSFMLLQFQVQTSPPSQSSLDSPPHLCRPEELSALLTFKIQIFRNQRDGIGPIGDEGGEDQAHQRGRVRLSLRLCLRPLPFPYSARI